MQSINFDEGYKTYAINGDENRVIRINVTDLNVKKRFDEATKIIFEMVDSINDDVTVEQITEADRVIRGQLDHIFGAGTCEMAFGQTNVLSFVGGGKMLIESFLDALMPVITADMKAAAAASRVSIEKKTEKYTAPVLAKPPIVGMSDRITAGRIDVSTLSKLSEEQKDALLMELMKK